MMKRTTAIVAMLSLAGPAAVSGIVLGTIAPASAEQTNPTAPVAKVFVPLAITTADGKKGLVTSRVANGKTVYALALSGKSAAPGTYALANGKNIKVVGPDGMVDAVSSTIMLNPQPLPP